MNFQNLLVVEADQNLFIHACLCSAIDLTKYSKYLVEYY